jgi:hypothetical protein
MEKMPINAYLDGNLTRKLEGFVINALPYQTYRSDFNMLYIANIDIENDENGIPHQISVSTQDTFFLSVTNNLGHIDYDMIKTIHAAGVLESDYEVMEYYPLAGDIDKFANYYEGKEVPPGGGYLQVAISPFGVSIVELLNGDTVSVFGNGKVWIEDYQRGFKGYKQVPSVKEILTNDSLKILKIAIYSRYTEYHTRKYSLNIFSPTMKIEAKPIEGQYSIDEPRLIHYSTNDVVVDENTGYQFLKNEKNNTLNQCSVTYGANSLLDGIGRMLKINESGFIDLSSVGVQIGDQFSIHTNFVIDEYASRGTVIFDAGYGITQSGYQTHKITVFILPSGELCYNSRYSDEWVNTGAVVEKNKEHVLTFTIENQKFDEADDDEYMAFIHLNGKQIWPEKTMLTSQEKIYLWRAKEAWRVYNEVCMNLPAPHPIQGGVDAKMICIKKLLEESGFVTYENLVNVYELYTNRPRACNADLADVSIGSNEDSIIRKFFFAQDSEKDLSDPEYYMMGQIAEISVFAPGLNREEIEKLHLLNITRIKTVGG